MTDVQTMQSNTMPAVQAPPDEAWGAEGTSADDMLIARISLQHELSQAVKQKKAETGDFINSVTGAVLGKPIEFIPVKTFLQWLIVDANDKKKMLGRCMLDKTNEDWSEKGVYQGKDCLRIRTLNFFVVRPDQPGELPCLISFKKSAMYAGKILSTHFQTSAMQRKTPARQTFKLSSERKMSNGNDYFVPTISAGRDSTPEEVAHAYKWYQALSTKDVKVSEEAAGEAVPF